MLAESFGATGFRVDKKEDFEKTLQKAKEIRGIKLIDLAFDYPKHIK